jgi:hypothetical protein
MINFLNQIKYPPFNYPVFARGSVKYKGVPPPRLGKREFGDPEMQMVSLPILITKN